MQSQTFGHAVICIGRKEFAVEDLSTITPLEIRLNDAGKGSIFLYFNSRIERDFVFIDDNFAPFQQASLSAPCAHYHSTDWDSCEITAFVVPLYPKIYLEAYQVEKYLLIYLKNYLQIHLKGGERIFFRMFLASSRSFKQHIALNPSLKAGVKEILISCTMPKFIWIAELSDPDLILERKGNGLIILDATEVNIEDNKPLILSVFQNTLTIWNDQVGELEDIPLDLGYFDIYTNNLGGF